MTNNKIIYLLRKPLLALYLGLLLLTSNTWANGADDNCQLGGQVKRIVNVDMIALNQPFWYSRMGAAQLDGIIYALASDVVYIEDNTAKPLNLYPDWNNQLTFSSLMSNIKGGKTTLQLRPDKRPRPIVLRANKKDCLQITFTNFLNGSELEGVGTDYAGVHIEGTEMFSASVNLKYIHLVALLGDLKKGLEDAIEEGAELSNIITIINDTINIIHMGEINPILTSLTITSTALIGLEKRLSSQTIIGGFSIDLEAKTAELVLETESLKSTISDNTARYSIKNDGAFIGQNYNNLAAPGERKTYSLFIREEGAFVLNSSADNFSNNLAGQTTLGLFGALNVQPEGAEYYRSQVSEVAMRAAQKECYVKSTICMDGLLYTEKGQPIINYQATYGSASKPVLNMLSRIGNTEIFNLVYTDPTAIITGPNAGAFAVNDTDPEFFQVPVTPERTQPWREFNIMYHEPTNADQAFAEFNSDDLGNTLGAGGDFFGINYGSAAIGPEIWANRLNVGPMHDCVTCEYEEFFLSSWAVGDPAMVVDVPANFSALTTPNPLPSGDSFPKIPPTSAPIVGPKATKAFFPDDPSNVYHSYMQDHVKMRIHHGGGTLHHLHHLHAHQWLHSPNNDDGHYLDSQLIGPGSSFTLEMVHNGSGNRNQTVGDSIFHCHFYPHFAEGMWSLWRVHDVFESGTKLSTEANGRLPKGAPAKGSRALPDGEIIAGTPIPGLVPLPTRPMAPMPSTLHIEEGQVVYGTPSQPDPDGTSITENPGYPFFIAGIAGERAPHPPMDFASLNGKALNGGLPRHVIKRPGGYDSDGTYIKDKNYHPDIVEYHNRFDFSKFYNKLDGILLPEDGTPVEKIAMDTHSIRYHPSYTPDGKKADFILNGLPPQRGAPYADPCVSDFGKPVPSAITPRRYRAVDMQMDVVLNKKGWHYSQQRFGVLWQDLLPTLNKERPPEPLFFRANSGDCIEYWLANVVPEYYELDDFQVRTPTDILGQHIHLVKFDVTSSDGGANGWNYEDGTFSPQAVVERIKSLNAGAGLEGYPEKLQAQAPTWLCDGLTDTLLQECLTKANTDKDWLGAQATVQRWYADPQLNNLGEDRTLRTVFTHDHFSPSTHQQAGLYMGLLVEPEGSSWKDSETGTPFYTRADGGPTSWAAVIETPESVDSYREFALEFQDFQLAYKQPDSGAEPAFTPYPVENRTSSYGNEESLNKVGDPLKTDYTAKDCHSSDSGATFDYVQCIANMTNQYSGYLAPDLVINPPSTGDYTKDVGPSFGVTVQTPTLISTTPPFALGTYSVNYRNEPIPYRVWDPTAEPQQQASGEEGDLANVYRSIKRVDTELNEAFDPFADTTTDTAPLTSGVYPYDPATPLLRAFQGDNVQVRTLVGAHINMHNFSMQGTRWLFEPTNERSGYRSNQPMGISEHFEMLFRVPPSTMNKVKRKTGGGNPTNRCVGGTKSTATFADYLYNPSSEENGLLNGNWGLMRSYLPGQHNLCLEPLPAAATVEGVEISSSENLICPPNAPIRSYNVSAIHRQVIYNQAKNKDNDIANGKAIDTHALQYVGCDSTKDANCIPNTDTTDTAGAAGAVEPFILRAAAGECISVKLTNKFVSDTPVFDIKEPISLRNPLLQFSYTATDGTEKSMTLTPSSTVGLAPQLVSYDINQSNGLNLGFNNHKNFNTNQQTVKIGESKTYSWYAGIIEPLGTKSVANCDDHQTVAGVEYCYNAAEFGSANLLTADPVEQTRFGLLAGMVIEPKGSCWIAQNNSVTGAKTSCIGEMKAWAEAIPGLTGLDASKMSTSITGTTVTVVLPQQVSGATQYFREFSVLLQDSLYASKAKYNAFNYASATMGQVAGTGNDPAPTNPNFDNINRFDKIGGTHPSVACGFSSALGEPYNKTGTAYPKENTESVPMIGDPQTPIFYANPGDRTRFRVMQPHGADQHVFELFGHVWQEEPYNNDSTVITNNSTSQWQGARMGLSAADRFDIILPSAGGTYAVPGDYLYRSFPGGDQMTGLWGIFRVGKPLNTYSTSDTATGECLPPNYPDQAANP